MMTRTSITAFAAMLLMAAAPGSARAQWQGGLNFSAGAPQGDFKSNISNNGYGIGAYVGYAPESVPIMVGIDLGFLSYGNETRRERFSTTIPDVMVDVNTSNNIGLAHLSLRLGPNSGVFRPYINGLVGVNYLYTTTEIRNRGLGDEVASNTNFDDVAFSYGGGGGLLVRVYGSDSDDAGISEVLIELRGHYLVGGEAEYLKKGSIRRENGQVTYDVQKSKTDLLAVQLGVSLRF